MIRYAIIFMFLSLMTSCARNSWDKQQFEDDEVKTRFVTGKVQRELVTADGLDSSELIITYSYYKDLDSVFKDSVNNAISNYTLSFTQFGEGDKNQPLSQGYFDKQADVFVAVYHEEIAIDDIGGVWSLEADFGINDFYKSFAELTVSAWAYTGGAHGNGSYTIEHFDKTDGRKLEPIDFFTDIDELNSICEPFFRTIFELDADTDLSDAGFWFEDNKFSINNNFYFTGNSVTFYYNTYEIAPYSGGPTELEIPIDKIKHLIKREI